MKTLCTLFAAVLVASVFAIGVKNPTPIPSGTTFKHINVTIGPDGIGRVDTGVHASQAPDSVWLYNETDEGSGYYGGMAAAEEEVENIPFVSQACITWGTVWYCANGTSTDSLEIDLNFYDDAAGPGNVCPLQEGGCNGAGLAAGSYQLTGLPVAGCWIVTFTFATPQTVLGMTQVGWIYKPTAGVTSMGPILANGNNSGMTLGKGMAWPFGVSYASGSGSDSDNSFTNVNGCWWWGCGGSIYANFMCSFSGDAPYEFELSGDYGINGPTFDWPRDHVWVGVTNSTGNSETNLVNIYMNPDTGDTWGGLQFGVADTYSVSFLRQDAYVSSTDAAAVPNVSIALDCLPTKFVHTLYSGDINGDNAVNLIDLGIVLSNYNKTGN